MDIAAASASEILFNIEPATWRDLNAVRHIEQVCFPQDAWPIWDMVGVLTFPNVVRLKAVIEGKVVGFIAGDQRGGENIAWIATVGVLTQYRKLGIGTALLKACEERLSRPAVRLCVRTSNVDAIRLYHRLGYHTVSRWARYYHDGEEATVMEKKRQV